MIKQIDLEQVRFDYTIATDYSDETLMAFAQNWFDPADVEWFELEESYCGDWSGLDEDDAIGDYLFDLATDCGDLENIPHWIRHNIDWRTVGRDARFSGEFRAERLTDIGEWAVFRNW